MRTLHVAPNHIMGNVGWNRRCDEEAATSFTWQCSGLRTMVLCPLYFVDCEYVFLFSLAAHVISGMDAAY
jgi:hypothetical protein